MALREIPSREDARTTLPHFCSKNVNEQKQKKEKNGFIKLK
jgi:hypothetical protein